MNLCDVLFVRNSSLLRAANVIYNNIYLFCISFALSSLAQPKSLWTFHLTLCITNQNTHFQLIHSKSFEFHFWINWCLFLIFVVGFFPLRFLCFVFAFPLLFFLFFSFMISIVVMHVHRGAASSHSSTCQLFWETF